MADLSKLDQTIEFLERIVQDDELCEQLNQKFAADHVLRDRATEALRLASRRLEDPWHLMHRLSGSATDVTMFQAGSAMGLWDALVEKAPKAVDVDALSEKTGAQSTLLVRILRYAASQGVVDQTDPKSFRANRSTRHLSTEGIKSALFINANILGPMKVSAHKHLASINYTEPTDPKNTAWAHAFGTTVSFFDHIASQPGAAEAFHGHMKFQQQFQSDWVEKTPLEPYLSTSTDHPPDRPLFVDVAGGNGRQALRVLQKYPSLVGRIVLQERPDMSVKCPPALTFTPFDLLLPNPTPHAKIYYLRYILHDWPDAQCKTILAHIRDAMDGDSVLLVNDLVIRDYGGRHPHWFAPKQDLAMMMGFAAKERTEGEFGELFEGVGLRRMAVKGYDAYGMAVQVVVKM